ncbi:MAG: Crp/Fnr family transcriptional regulator [Flavisolibacter sp.]
MEHQLKNFLEQMVRLEEDAWEAMERIIKPALYKKNELFLRQGQICRQLGFISKGFVRLYYLHDGEEITKDFNFENAICGSYASFSRQEPARFNIVAMEDLEVLLIGRDDLYALYDQYPSLQKAGRQRIEYMFIKKEEREASFLLDSAQERYQQLLAKEPEIADRAQLKHLASYLGIKPETLSRIRKKEREGKEKKLKVNS